MNARRGFTLLEVMVSLSILALSIVAIAGINANSFESSNYAKYVTVATLLARGKMIDVEEQLRKDGFSDSEKTYDGDFEKEGFANFKWKAVCRPVEVDVNQLVGSLFGGEVDKDQLPGQVSEFLDAMKGEKKDPNAAPAAGGGGQVGGQDLSAMLGGGLLENMFKQVGDTLSKSIREITLEITWGDKKDGDTLSFVQYVVTTGRLSLPSGFSAGTVAGAAGAAVPPPGVTQGADGQYRDNQGRTWQPPASPGLPWTASDGTQSPGGGLTGLPIVPPNAGVPNLGGVAQPGFWQGPAGLARPGDRQPATLIPPKPGTSPGK